MTPTEHTALLARLATIELDVKELERRVKELERHVQQQHMLHPANFPFTDQEGILKHIKACEKVRIA